MKGGKRGDEVGLFLWNKDLGGVLLAGEVKNEHFERGNVYLYLFDQSENEWRKSYEEKRFLRADGDAGTG